MNRNDWEEILMKAAEKISSAIFTGFMILSFTNCMAHSAKADTLKVLMIDAGTPKYTAYYGSAVGKDLSIYPGYHHHAEASYKFIMAGSCRSVNCLKPSCADVVVDWCMFWDERFKVQKRDLYKNCLEQGIKGKYDIVNMSLAGPDFDPVEKEQLERMSKNSLIVVAAGNRALNTRDYPATFATSVYGPIIAVSALDLQNYRLPSSNKDDLTVDFLGISSYYNTDEDMWYSMQGTSVAAALYTNHLIKEMCPSKKKRINHGQD